MSLTQDQVILSDTHAAAVTLAKSSRIPIIDLQRGLIMMLMAFAHCREYVGTKHYSNLNWDNPPAWQGTTLLDLCQQVFVSMTVAGGFFMMMGIGIIFLYQARLKEGWSIEKICQYLIMRGLLLVFLQLTLLQCFEIITQQRMFFYLGVLFSLGSCMILSSVYLYTINKFKILKYYLLLAIIILIPGINQLIINHHADSAFSGWQTIFLLEGSGYENIDINFWPFPWFPAVAFGLLIGQLLQEYKDQAFKWIGMLSVIFLLSFFLLRFANVTGWFHQGDYKFFAAHSPFNFANMFSVSKHPPSIAYFLWALGINMACLTGLYYVNQNMPVLLKPLQFLKVFGRCALFFFILHWFVYYGLSLLLANRYADMAHLSMVWLYGLIILYFSCHFFYQFKQTTPTGSLWRMF